MQTQIIFTEDPHALALAIQALQSGQLVAFPTDTVYGVGGMMMDAAVIDSLFAVKGRDQSKAIPVLLGDIDHLKQVTAEMGGIASRLAERFWPGPLTLVVPRRPDLPANLSPQPTVGVRMPEHAFALALLREAGPLAVTSANLSGGENACSAKEVFAQLDGRIPLILDGGRTPGGSPSTVVDCTGSEPVILRAGPIDLADLLAAWGGASHSGPQEARSY